MYLRNSGESNAFRVTVADADGNAGDAAGLSQLAYDPSTSVSQMSLTLPAANARAILNGLPISSESNSLSSAIDGLNITLLKPTTADVTLTLAQDKETLKNAPGYDEARLNAPDYGWREEVSGYYGASI